MAPANLLPQLTVLTAKLLPNFLSGHRPAFAQAGDPNDLVKRVTANLIEVVVPRLDKTKHAGQPDKGDVAVITVTDLRADEGRLVVEDVVGFWGRRVPAPILHGEPAIAVREHLAGDRLSVREETGDLNPYAIWECVHADIVKPRSRERIEPADELAEVA